MQNANLCEEYRRQYSQNIVFLLGLENARPLKVFVEKYLRFCSILSIIFNYDHYLFFYLKDRHDGFSSSECICDSSNQNKLYMSCICRIH